MQSASQTAPLRAGYAAVEVSPPAGVDLTGFIARPGPSTGVLDPLEIRALAFEDGAERRVALVTCDLVGLGKHLVARVRQQVSDAAGIPPEAQLYNCSHTHGGPETGVLTTIGHPDAAYLETLERRMVAAVVEASRTLTPVRIATGMAEVPGGLAINRVYRRVNRPDAYDRRLTIARLERLDGVSKRGGAAPLATIVSFACHAVSLGADERMASSDFVGPLRTELEAAGTGHVLYVNGCGGDVNPASMDARGRDARDALAHGLAQAALAAAQEAKPEPRDTGAPSISWAQEWVRLPLLALRTADEAAELLAAAKRKLPGLEPGSPAYRGLRVTGVEYPLAVIRAHYGSAELPQVEAEVQALRIGSLAVVALPGEIFTSHGVAIRATSPFGAARTMVAGWSNDNVGYIPDRDAYPLGGYEVDVASRYYGFPAGWAPEAGEAFVAAAGRTLRQVASTSDDAG